MLNYKGAKHQEAFAAASNDSTWSKPEQKVLAQIAEALEDGIFGHESVCSENIGSGRTYWIKGSKIQFHVHDASQGCNLGRVK